VSNSTQEKTRGAGLFSALRSPSALIKAALLAALSVVLGKYVPVLNIDWLRISFENLPILLAGILLGPVIGAAVGITQDLIGCLLMGYAVNPFITLGAALVGAISGVMYRAPLQREKLRLPLAVLLAHAIGSMLVKSVGLVLWYGIPMGTILLRIPTYLIIAVLEYLIIRLLLANRAFRAQIMKGN